MKSTTEAKPKSQQDNNVLYASLSVNNEIMAKIVLLDKKYRPFRLYVLLSIIKQ